MELFVYGLQISAMIVFVVFLVALLLNGFIALFVRLDQRLTRPAVSTVETPLEETVVPIQEGLSPELLAAITGAIEATTKKKIRIKSIRYRRQAPRSSWVMKGRAALLASHKPKR